MFSVTHDQKVNSENFTLQGEDVRMQEIMKLAHEFLQNFCAGNQQNQVLLHKHINLFLNPGVSTDNLCQRLTQAMMKHRNVNATLPSFRKTRLTTQLFI